MNAVLTTSLEPIVAMISSCLSIFVATCEKFYPLAASTVFVDFTSLEQQYLQPHTHLVGGQMPLLKYTLSLFMSYPFGYILSILPSAPLRHMFSCFGGVILSQWVFGYDWIHALLSSIGTYVLCLIVPRKYVGRAVFIFAMGYMSLSHIYRMYGPLYLAGIFDFTGTQMVLTMKLTSFAFNLHDGSDPSVHQNHEDKKKNKMMKERQYYSIKSLPNPLAFFGYVFCFTCLMAGPAFEYNDYIEGIKRNKLNANDKLPSHKQVSSWGAAMRNLCIGVICLVLHLVFATYFPHANLYDATFIAANAWWYRLFVYAWCTLMGDRFKYYFAWKVAEGCSNLAGFGFEGYDDNGKVIGWRGVENIDIISFETAPNVKVLSRSWNKRTQGWLEKYTYQRTNGSLIAVYFVSALWHGLYPGFFLFFMSIPLITQIERLLRKKINPLIIPSYDPMSTAEDIKRFPEKGSPWWYNAIGFVFTFSAMNYIIQPFPLQSWERSATVLGSYYYIPHILFVVLYVLLEAMPSPVRTNMKRD